MKLSSPGVRSSAVGGTQLLRATIASRRHGQYGFPQVADIEAGFAAILVPEI
jgi:hypothetical protein